MVGSLPGSGAAGPDPVAPQPQPSGIAPGGGETAPAAMPLGAPAPPPTASPDPAAAPAYPVTGAPYPVTGVPYPVTGAPYPVTAAPYGPVPPPAPRRSPWVIVLGILSGVLLLTSGALGALYYLDREEAKRVSAEQQTQIADLQAEVEQLKDDLDETETRLQRTEDDLADAQECPDAVQSFLDLAANAAVTGQGELPPAEVQQALFDMVRACGVSL